MSLSVGRPPVLQPVLLLPGHQSKLGDWKIPYHKLPCSSVLCKLHTLNYSLFLQCVLFSQDSLPLHILFLSGTILPFYDHLTSTSSSFNSHIKHHFFLEVFLAFPGRGTGLPLHALLYFLRALFTWDEIYQLRASPLSYSVNSLRTGVMDLIFYFLPPSTLSGIKQENQKYPLNTRDWAWFSPNRTNP